MVQLLWESLAFPLKLNVELPHDPGLPLPGLHTNVHSSVIPISQKVEITQMSIDGWTEKQNAVSSYTGVFFSHKKE